LDVMILVLAGVERNIRSVMDNISPKKIENNRGKNKNQNPRKLNVHEGFKVSVENTGVEPVTIFSMFIRS